MRRTSSVRRAILGGLVSVLLVTAWVVVCAAAAARPATFCNPVDLDQPLARLPAQAAMPKSADPAVLFFKDEYWVFTSAAGGYWHSPDLTSWRPVESKGLPAGAGAPAVAVIGGRMHWMAAEVRGLYATDDPLAGEWTKVADTEAYADPALFLDDDGRLYVYYGSAEKGPIRAVELAPGEDFKVVRGPVDCVSGDFAFRGWEVYGEGNRGAPYRGRMRYDPWIEGAAMIKHKGRYYLQYAAPSADSATSAEGVFVGDSALGPFSYATYSPFSHKPTGFLAGAGRGTTFLDAAGRLWRAAGVSLSQREGRERRLALFPAAFLPDGQLAADTYLGDYPQYVPGVVADPLEGNSPGWMLLSREKRAEASSSRDGLPAESAFDDNARTRWSAASGRAGEWLRVDLGKRCRIDALQISFAGMDSATLAPPGDDTYRYAVEVSGDGRKWNPLLERKDGARAVTHDYVQLARPAVSRYLRLVNVRMPGGGTFAVNELRVFGSGRGEPPSEVRGAAVSRDAMDPRCVRISWAPAQRAEFHIVRYGVVADRLFNNYQVYDANYLELCGLNASVPYFVSIDAVNDSGVTKAETVLSVK